jgi:hypothetical protein
MTGDCPTVIRDEKPKGVGCQSHGPLKSAQWVLLAGGSYPVRLSIAARFASPLGGTVRRYLVNARLRIAEEPADLGSEPFGPKRARVSEVLGVVERASMVKPVTDTRPRPRRG